MTPATARPKGPIFLAIGLGLATSLSLLVYLQQLQHRQTSDDLVTLVVAARSVPPETRLTAADLRIHHVPRLAFPAAGLHRVDEALGRINRVEFVPDDLVLDAKCYPKGADGGLSLSLRPGQRAMTVAVDDVSGVAGFVKPGSHVDVVGAIELNGRPAARVILQDATVLAVAQDRDDPDHRKAKIANSVTLAVTPSQAEAIALATDRGKIRLALRGDQDRATVATTGTHWAANPPKTTVADRPIAHTTAPRPLPLIPSPKTKPPQTLAAARPQLFSGVEIIRGTKRENS